MSKALKLGTAYVLGLSALGFSPFDIPEFLSGATADLQLLHLQAKSRLAYERLTYRRLLQTAPKLQLAIHMTGSNRKALVDAILFGETLLTGALKCFLRSDICTFTEQGYGFMGVYRPALAGTGNDITVSTKPSTNGDMRALWLELERLGMIDLLVEPKPATPSCKVQAPLRPRAACPESAKTRCTHAAIKSANWLPILSSIAMINIIYLSAKKAAKWFRSQASNRCFPKATESWKTWQ